MNNIKNKKCLLKKEDPVIYSSIYVISLNIVSILVIIRFGIPFGNVN